MNFDHHNHHHHFVHHPYVSASEQYTVYNGNTPYYMLESAWTHFSKSYTAMAQLMWSHGTTLQIVIGYMEEEKMNQLQQGREGGVVKEGVRSITDLERLLLLKQSHPSRTICSVSVYARDMCCKWLIEWRTLEGEVRVKSIEEFEERQRQFEQHPCFSHCE